MPTQGEVSIRFSVQDAETVRTALDKLGKDGQAALDKFNTAGQAPSKSLNALSGASNQLKSSVKDLAYSAGPLGEVLLSLGPTGLVVAATFGAAAAAASAIKERAENFRQYATEVSNASESTGFTTSQIQALTKVLAEHGVGADDAANGLQKFATEQVNARQGGGQLYDLLRKINPAFAEAFASARTPAGALDVLAKAIASVDNQTGLLLAKLAFGKGSGGFSAAFKDIIDRGGIAEVQRELEKVGYIIDGSIIKKQSDAAVASANKAKETERNWNAAAAKIYEAWKDAWGDDSWWGNLSKKAVVVADVIVTKLKAVDKFFGLGPAETGPRVPVYGGSTEPAPKVDDETKRLEQIATLTRRVQEERERLGLLGDTATATEKVTARDRELSLALLERKKITGVEAALVSDSYRNQVEGAQIAQRAVLGVATEEERRYNFLQRLDIQIKSGVVAEGDRERAIYLYNRQLKETIDNERVRAATLPGLERMIIDASSLNKTLDQFGTSVAGDVGNAFVQITSGTQSASDGFKALEQAVLQSLARMVYQMTVARLVAQSLNSVLGFFGGGGGSGAASPQATGNPTGIGGLYASGGVFSGGRVTAFASGGVIDRPTLFPMANGMGLMGEAGPEAVMPLRKGRDGRLGVSTDGGGGRAPVVNVIIENNSGAEATAGAPRANSSGGTDIQVMIKQAVKDGIGRGEFDGVMGARFGQRSGTVRR